MKILTYDVKKIISDLQNNKVIVIPTDTCYGLIAINNQDNVRKINILKQRDVHKKIPLLISDKKYVKTRNISVLKKLNKWPKFTTIIFSKKEQSYRLLHDKELLFIISICGGVLCSSSFNKHQTKIIKSKNDIELNLFKNDDINIYFKENFKNSKPSKIIEYNNNLFKVVRER